MNGSVAVTALLFGLLSAASLPLGAALGVSWQPGDRVLAVLLAFGGGALLAALTLDLVAPGVSRGHLSDLALGAVTGGVLFKLLDRLVNRRGGYLRKHSTAVAYWHGQARRRLDTVLVGLQRTRPLGDLPGEVKDEILSITQVRDVPAGTWLHRAGEPPKHLLIVQDGVVQLRDPQSGGAVFEELGRNAAFGRMSFLSGLPRATEAYTPSGCRVLAIPREPLMELAESSVELRAALRRLIVDPEVTGYLEHRHGIGAQEAARWQAEAVADLDDGSTWAPPRLPSATPGAVLADELAAEHRCGFFAPLSRPVLERVADELILAEYPAGHTYFGTGQPADRMYLLRSGRVLLVDPDNLSGEPQEVGPGECFGALSFFTGGLHSATAVSPEPSRVAVLRRDELDDLVVELPELRTRLADFLREEGVTAYLTGRRSLDPRAAASWMDRAAKTVEGGHVLPSLADMTRTLAGHEGAAMAMFLGILLDGIPESFVIGANVLVGGTVTLSLLAGLFLANFPEALSSSVGMREQGMSRRRVVTMWTGLMVITGLGAALGTVLLASAPASVFALVEGLAAGAMLTMIAETMLPEAYHRGGGVVGLSTLGGFLAAIFANELG